MKIRARWFVGSVLAPLTMVALTGCEGSNRPSFQGTVGGTVTGLSGTISLALNRSETREITTSGAFGFLTPLSPGQAYSVTISAQPALQTCSVANGAGSMPWASVSNVTVTCVTNTHSVGGTVSGLAGTIELQNGSDILALSVDGSFSFPTRVPSNGTYAVTVHSQPAAQTCTVDNGAGTVGTSNVVNVGVVCVANTYTVGGSVSGLVTGLMSDVVLQLNSGADLAISEAGAFTFATPLTAGATYAVTVTTQPIAPAQRCVASNATGTIGAGNVTNVTITCALPTGRLAFVTGSSPDSVSAHAIDASTGDLSTIGSHPLASIAFHPVLTPDNRFLYVPVPDSNHISAYSVDALSGTLTGLAGSPFPVIQRPRALSITRDGRFMHVISQTLNLVATYAIDSASGVPSATAIPSVPTGDQPLFIATAPNGRFVYVSNVISSSVTAYTLDIASGELSTVGTYSTGHGAAQIAIDPRGRFLYVPTYNGNAVRGFEIDDVSGALTPVPGSPFAAGSAPFAIDIDAGGRFAYVANSFSNNIFAYAIDPASGTLSTVPGSPFPSPDAIGVAVDPSGRFVYAANGALSQVSVFDLDPANGALTLTPSAPFPTPARPAGITILRQW